MSKTPLFKNEKKLFQPLKLSSTYKIGMIAPQDPRKSTSPKINRVKLASKLEVLTSPMNQSTQEALETPERFSSRTKIPKINTKQLL